MFTLSEFCLTVLANRLVSTNYYRISCPSWLTCAEIAACMHLHYAPLLFQFSFTSALRRGNYRLQLCSYSYELLMGYLQEHKFMSLISVINQHMHMDGEETEII